MVVTLLGLLSLWKSIDALDIQRQDGDRRYSPGFWTSLSDLDLAVPEITMPMLRKSSESATSSVVVTQPSTANAHTTSTQPGAIQQPANEEVETSLLVSIVEFIADAVCTFLAIVHVVGYHREVSTRQSDDQSHR